MVKIRSQPRFPSLAPGLYLLSMQANGQAPATPRVTVQ